MSTTTTYLITGANRGIGFQFASILSLRSNTKVIATTRSESSQLTELAASRGNIEVLKLAVDDDESVQQFGQDLSKLADLQIDYFISNAGYSDSYSTAYETSRENYIKHWEINTLGPIEVFKVIKPFLAPKNKLIFISTLAASISGLPNFPASLSAYGSSKLALNYLVRELSIELKDSSIVVALSPGVVSTDMGAHGAKELKKQMGFDIPTITSDESVEGQLKVIDGLTAEDNGKFLSYDASEYTW